MSEKKNPEAFAEEMRGAAVTELDEHDLDSVVGGVSNGNCGGLCSPGNTVPGGVWENGNCK